MNTLSEDPAQRTCRHCGMSISGTLYAREHDGYCCEGCFFSARAQRAFATADEEAQLALVEALAAALDAREHETGLHSKRVACHTLVLAKHFTADAQLLHQVYWGALLHDIGKIGIPDAILLKDGALTASEWQIMRTHPEIGHRILSHAPSMAEAAAIVLNHEERYDGSGYARVRHPQYIGFVAIMFGFLLQWPTIITLVMFPILVFMYVRLARREERDARAEFGDAYARYEAGTPAFFPGFGGTVRA